MGQSSSEAAVRRLLSRFARRRHSDRPNFEMPHATDSDPNREFSRPERTWVYFLMFLPVFVLLYAIVEKMHVR